MTSPPSWNAPGNFEAEPPARGTVFAQLLWRIIVVSVGGGVVVSAVFIAAAFALDENDDELLAWLPVVVIVAALMGLLLGVVSGLIVGAVGSIVLVPYRGKAFSRRFAMIATLLSIAAFFSLLGVSTAEPRIWLVVGGGALVLGAIVSPWLVGWYVKRMAA